MKEPKYSAQIGESMRIGEGISREVLLHRIMDLTVRAAVARTIDQDDWEHEELRRKGLSAIQLFRNEKAIWIDADDFEAELLEAKREHIEERFSAQNELMPELYAQLERDLRSRWRLAGYEVPCLLKSMRELFIELERDATDYAETARDHFVDDILRRFL